ncbi:MAG: sugar phosphate isomerase/epimerase [Planctomycetota bacterium]|jgi:sugar phosphate isomerase/epimerase|nr:sugar phosphate isomerase/epimerase [Planctomycetota bacterium]
MSLPISFRTCVSLGNDLPACCAWAATQGFAAIEWTTNQLDGISAARAAGLNCFSVDLGGWSLWPQLLSRDDSIRKAAVASARIHIAACADAAQGPLHHLLILLPDSGCDRRQALAPAQASLADLQQCLNDNNARIGIEGWPGPQALGCTPESLRAVLGDLDESIGINFDPSHLLRQGIDPLRFVAEFGHRIHHVHGKDCECFTELIYDHGREIGGTVTNDLPFGGPWWRYCIPGQGQLRWRAIIKALLTAGYTGPLSIELEDGNYNGTPTSEEDGLLFAKKHLESCLGDKV